MGKQKSSLTEWPEDLKDVVDWLLRVGEMDQGGSGNSNKLNLQKAVCALNDYGETTSVLKAENTGGLFNSVADGLRVFIGYSSGGGRDLDGQGIGRYGVGGYSSSYTTNAKWTWNNDSEQNSKTCAHILLGSMPLLYYGLTYLLWRCSGRHGWQNQIIQGDWQGTQLNAFMQDMNYDSSRLNSSKGSAFIQRVKDEIRDFTNVSASAPPSYPEFLKKLQENGKPNLAGQAMSAPLYALYAASHAYLQSKWKSHMLNDIPQTKAEIEATLTGYSEAVTKLEPTGAKKLSDACLTLLSHIKDVFHPDPPASSSGAAAAGGVLGTAALGTTAALATNVGGITTTLKNLIPIFK
ncbi:variant erythrocyte surface antigen-1 family protein [Babesia caballi]|uniref:Variant erythrocyte surface antigen-1 family protein n=1 Tax=Babesia caballi TaxID=5871 RepID=A0AAV4M0S4_BABCB|nr:variant erythrocyte surface antigen-1 family protein [Babesia caballi]